MKTVPIFAWVIPWVNIQRIISKLFDISPKLFLRINKRQRNCRFFCNLWRIFEIQENRWNSKFYEILQLLQIAKNGDFKKCDPRKGTIAKEVRKCNLLFDKSCTSHNDKHRKVAVWRNMNAASGQKESTKNCIKGARIRNFSGPYFLAFGLNKNRYSVSLRIKSDRRKIQARKTPYTDTFHAVKKTLFLPCILEANGKRIWSEWRLRIQKFVDVETVKINGERTDCSFS